MGLFIELFISYYEELACGVLKTFDENSDDTKDGIILLQKAPGYFNQDCFETAIQGADACTKFISLNCIQNLITRLWDGPLNTKYDISHFIKVFFKSICKILIKQFCLQLI